jgi:type IV secretory pathway VirJ component
MFWRAGILSFLISGTFFPLSLVASEVDTLTIEPFGKVFIYMPPVKSTTLIIMISGDGGWKYGVIGFSERFSKKNAVVAGVDILRYYSGLRKRKTECYTVAADFLDLATVIEKKYNFPAYTPSLLMGYSSGATLVYAILAQARPGTFVGGISLGFCPDMELPKMLCQINSLKEKKDSSGKKFFLQPASLLKNPWIVLQGKLDVVCSYNDVVNFVKETGNAELITLPKVGHGFSNWNDFMPQWEDAYLRLIDKYIREQELMAEDKNLLALPLVITNAKIIRNRSPFAFMVSGDGGWYWFEQSIADSLASLGIATIGLDAKRYFWERKSPEETTSDITAAIRFYSNFFGKSHLIMIGYSLGAEIIPFILARLPGDIRSEISSSVLLSPGDFTDFEIHLSNMIGLGNPNDTLNVVKEINKLSSENIICIFGKDEKTNVPDRLNLSKIKIVYIPGDHHYNFDLPLIINTLRKEKVL